MMQSRRGFFKSMAAIAAVTAAAPALRIIDRMEFVAPAPEIAEAFEYANGLTLKMLQDCFEMMQRNCGRSPIVMLVSAKQYNGLIQLLG